ncbi:monooxygenase [Gammaproteobacteria bacterium ESL0073]|nr:monooxygenase [Gammaproteobacteria bacterium ESL0073]
MKQLNIVIAGAGMGGLTTAIALQQANHKVHVYDKVSKLQPAGSAISIWSNGVRVLDKLGVGGAIRVVSGNLNQMSFRNKEGQQLTTFSLIPLYQEINESACPISRTHLQEVLLKAVGEQHVTVNNGVIGYEQGENSVTVLLSNGEKIKADVLVAADGTHSKLRNDVNNQVIERRYCGYVNWNGRIKYSPELAIGRDEWIQHVSDGKRVSLMPMGDDLYYFFFDVPLPQGSSAEKSQYKDELKKYFEGWSAPIQYLIDNFDPATTTRVEVYNTEPLPKLTKGNVVLIGDAAHATSPDLGQGGCLAMEDAWVLADELSHDNPIKQALTNYQTRRMDRVTDIVGKAYNKALITHGYKKQEMLDWYEELALETGENIRNGLKKTILGGVI